MKFQCRPTLDMSEPGAAAEAKSSPNAGIVFQTRQNAMRDIKHRQVPRQTVAREKPGMRFQLPPIALGMRTQAFKFSMLAGVGGLLIDDSAHAFQDKAAIGHAGLRSYLARAEEFQARQTSRRRRLPAPDQRSHRVRHLDAACPLQGGRRQRHTGQLAANRGTNHPTSGSISAQRMHRLVVTMNTARSPG